MKRIVMFVCVFFALSVCGCYGRQGAMNLPGIQEPSINEETNEIPKEDLGGGIIEVTPENSNKEESETDIPTAEPDDEIEEKKKKRYAVSTVNGLRVRSAANSNSAVIGYLDKNDAVSVIGENGNYYKTVYKEKTAYVYADYCEIMEIELASEDVERAVDTGSSLLGYPYVWGSQRYHWGNGKLNTNFVKGEFDCSALVQYVYYISNRVNLDVTSRTQVNNGKPVNREDLARGDLMFFTNASRKNKTGTERIGHVGIYFGNNYILHTASDHAVIEPISPTRWSYYITARRVV